MLSIEEDIENRLDISGQRPQLHRLPAKRSKPHYLGQRTVGWNATSTGKQESSQTKRARDVTRKERRSPRGRQLDRRSSSKPRSNPGVRHARDHAYATRAGPRSPAFRHPSLCLPSARGPIVWENRAASLEGCAAARPGLVSPSGAAAPPGADLRAAEVEAGTTQGRARRGDGRRARGAPGGA